METLRGPWLSKGKIKNQTAGTPSSVCHSTSSSGAASNPSEHLLHDAQFGFSHRSMSLFLIRCPIPTFTSLLNSSPFLLPFEVEAHKEEREKIKCLS